MTPEKLDQLRQFARVAKQGPDGVLGSLVNAVPVLCDEVEKLSDQRDGARMAAGELRVERDEARAAVDGARKVLTEALSAWEPEHEYYEDRAARKGYSHDETAAQVYGAAIDVATKALAELDGRGA